jgi:hypothetical protein
MPDAFERWWTVNGSKTVEERRRIFESLSSLDRKELIRSMFEGHWHELFFQNLVDDLLDDIKMKHEIDLIDMHIQATKFSRVYLVDKETWDEICTQVMFYAEHYNMELIFGGLIVTPWGKHGNMYRVTGKRS